MHAHAEIRFLPHTLEVVTLIWTACTTIIYERWSHLPYNSFVTAKHYLLTSCNAADTGAISTASTIQV